MKRSIYFIRVGGTAMAGVAVALGQLGWEVYGSEEVLYEPMKSYLAEAGVTVYSQFDPHHLQAIAPEYVVVGNAVSRGNEELEFALEQRMNLISLPDLVGAELIRKHTSIVVAGTHGKTTTTSMIAWIFECAQKSPGFLIGAVPRNFETACRPAKGDNSYFVTEGDEYDSAYWDKRSKFLHYRPDYAIVNNLEFDHADIFSSLEEITKSFRLFIRLVPRNGAVIANGDDPHVLALLASKASPVVTFGFGSGNDYRALPQGENRFELIERGTNMGPITLRVTGELNQRNFLAAATAARLNGIAFEAIQRAAESYLPPKRRMEEIGEFQGSLVIDDFGHHPTAVRETLAALRQQYPGRKITAVFEPRSNSTTRNIFQSELVTCFEIADRVALGALDRPERYSESERLDTAQLVRQWEAAGKTAMAISLEQGSDAAWGRFVRDWLSANVQAGELIVLFSNGDLGGLRAMLLSQG